MLLTAFEELLNCSFIVLIILLKLLGIDDSNRILFSIEFNFSTISCVEFDTKPLFILSITLSKSFKFLLFKLSSNSLFFKKVCSFFTKSLSNLNSSPTISSNVIVVLFISLINSTFSSAISCSVIFSLTFGACIFDLKVFIKSYSDLSIIPSFNISSNVFA